jgi:hypothetical protein
MMRPGVMPVSDVGQPGGEAGGDAEDFPEYFKLFGSPEGVTGRG